MERLQAMAYAHRERESGLAADKVELERVVAEQKEQLDAVRSTGGMSCGLREVWVVGRG